MKIFRFFLLLVIAAVSNITTVQAKSAATSPSIVGGHIETNYYGVGWLHIWYKDYSSPGLCSATLISDHVLLTAAHCIYGSATYGKPVALYFGSQVQAPTVTDQQYPDTLDYYKATDWAYSPDFSTDTYDHDVGLVLLDPSVEISLPYIPVAAQGLTTTGVKGVAIGYGRSKAQVYATNGVKRSTTVTISAVTPTTLIWDFNQQTGEGSGCSGDSGGPVLYLDDAQGPIVIGDISHAGSGLDSLVFCRGESVAMNVGTDAKWIQDQSTSWSEAVSFLPVP